MLTSGQYSAAVTKDTQWLSYGSVRKLGIFMTISLRGLFTPDMVRSFNANAKKAIFVHWVCSNFLMSCSILCSFDAGFTLQLSWCPEWKRETSSSDEDNNNFRHALRKEKSLGYKQQQEEFHNLVKSVEAERRDVGQEGKQCLQCCVFTG